MPEAREFAKRLVFGDSFLKKKIKKAPRVDIRQGNKKQIRLAKSLLIFKKSILL